MRACSIRLDSEAVTAESEGFQKNPKQQVTGDFPPEPTWEDKLVPFLNAIQVIDHVQVS